MRKMVVKFFRKKTKTPADPFTNQRAARNDAGQQTKIMLQQSQNLSKICIMMMFNLDTKGGLYEGRMFDLQSAA